MVAMPPPIAQTRSVAITGATSQRPRPRRWRRTWMTIQPASTARAGGQTQLRRSMTAGPGWKTTRPSPIKPRTIAGTAVQTCGWALKREDVKAIRPQPTPKAKRTDPVTTGSELPDARLRRKATARAAPATIEPKMARTGERPLLPPRDGWFMRGPLPERLSLDGVRADVAHRVGFDRRLASADLQGSQHSPRRGVCSGNGVRVYTDTG